MGSDGEMEWGGTPTCCNWNVFSVFPLGFMGFQLNNDSLCRHIMSNSLLPRGL